MMMVVMKTTKTTTMMMMMMTREMMTISSLQEAGLLTFTPFGVAPSVNFSR